MAGIAIQGTYDDLNDDRPLAVRRKRRSSSALAKPNNKPGQATGSSLHSQAPDDPALDPPHTPNPKKRVRFSDPGLELAPASSSTALTPILKRSTLISQTGPSPKLRLGAQKPKQRRTIPCDLSVLLTSSVLPTPPGIPPPTPYTTGVVHFEPIRQVLDDRMKRRIKRNNMSTEINEIENDKKSILHLTQEVQELKEELTLAKQSRQQAADKAQEDDNAERIQGLEAELVALKEQMREKSAAAESLASTDMGPRSPVPGNPDHGNGDDDCHVVDFDDNENAWANMSNEASTSTLDTSIQDSIPPQHLMAVKGRADVSNKSTSSSMGTAIQDSIPSPNLEAAKASAHVSNQATTSTMDAATQASIPSPTYRAVYQSARMSLERLFPGEITLGLNIEDPKPLFDTTLEILQNLRAQTILVNKDLSASKNQEANMRNQFNALLQQMTRAREYADGLNAQMAEDKARSDQAQRRIQHLQIGLEQKSAMIGDMETELDTKQRSIQKLQDALESYRVEIGKLESLITSLETEHGTAMSALRNEMNESLADLHCNVASETTGRRAAEKQAVERGERIRELEQMERELKGAVSEKQQTIREMEKELVEAQEGREKETGAMNVTIGILSSNLQEGYNELIRVGAEKDKLVELFDAEKAAGVKAVEAVQAELVRCSDKVEGVMEIHFQDMQRRGAEVAQHRGLLTPVTTTKFKDVEGCVEIKRGKTNKKRSDSGIAGFEEAEFEDPDFEHHGEEIFEDEHSVEEESEEEYLADEDPMDENV